MAAGHEMRVSDAEREAAAAELREHFASGRLDQDELNERLDRVFAAKTRGDLNAALHRPAVERARLGPGAARSNAGSGSATGASGPTARLVERAAAVGSAGRRPHGRRASGAASAGRVHRVLLSVLLVVGILGVFGIGTGRPIGVVLIFAAFALLRRLLFIIFGAAPGRRGGRGRGPPPLAVKRRRRPARCVRDAPPGDKIVVRDLSWKGPNFRSKREVRWRCVITLPFPVAAATRPATGTARAAHRGRGTRRRGGGPRRALRGRPADPR